MRIEPFTIGKKAKIVRSDQDKWRFMQALRFFNDSNSSQNVLRNILNIMPVSDTDRRMPKSVFELGWPPNWPKKKPLVKILCYCLLPNHFHLLLKEIREGGISKFMQKLGIGFTNYFNLKHNEVGRLFQSSYKGRTITDDIYLKYLSVYIQVINVLELFPGGLKEAFKNTGKALKFVEKYPFSSYQDFIDLRKSLIIDKDILGEIFPSSKNYKEFVCEAIKGKKYELLDDLKLEE